MAGIEELQGQRDPCGTGTDNDQVGLQLLPVLEAVQIGQHAQAR